jgi:DNA excision repair protein ERCC-2
VLELEGEEFVHVYDRSNCTAKLKILCLDPSNQLKKRNEGFYSAIGMSATLSPLEFYRDVLGFNRSARLVALPSPFPAENRKILVIPEVSTTYKQRSKYFRKIAQIVEEVISVRVGNYFVFFPSFDFLKEVSPFLRPAGYQVLTQERVMPDHTRNALFDRLSDPTAAHLVLAVQGGVFAEGVDYPGELAVGAVIVGPGLPKVSFESELMRQYFEENFSKGFEYAYLYPGMNRVVQSAGRIIRTETDRGVILLLDKRFTYENYASLFPRDWYDSSPSELISKEYLRELSRFWGLQQRGERGK